MANHYEILGVPRNASKREIQLAFRKQAAVYHPDKNPGNTAAEEHFKKLNMAYQTLSDPSERRKYDNILNYGHATSSSNQRTTTHRPPPSSSQPRPRKRKPPIETRQQKIVRVIKSLGVTFLIVIGLYIFLNLAGNKYDSVEKAKEDQQAAIKEKKYYEIDTLFTQGKDEEAFGQLNNLLTAFPDWDYGRRYYHEKVANLRQKAVSTMKSGDHQAAMKHLLLVKDITLDEDYYDTLSYLLSDIFALVGEYDEALDQLDEVNLSLRFNFLTDFKRGRIYKEGLKDPKKAQIYFNKAVETTKRYYDFHYGAAYWLIPAAMDIPKGHYELYLNKAITDYELGNFEEAILAFNWCNSIDNTQAEPYYYLGFCYSKLNKRAKACRAWNKARERGTTSELEEIISLSCP